MMSINQSDQILLKSYLSGDEAAFEILIRKHKDKVFAFILSKIKNYNPDVLLISLGVDTYENDPISFFKLKSDDFFDVGRKIASINLPTLFVMEGGYAIKEIGLNTVNTLKGFENG